MTAMSRHGHLNHVTPVTELQCRPGKGWAKVCRAVLALNLQCHRRMEKNETILFLKLGGLVIAVLLMAISTTL